MPSSVQLSVCTTSYNCAEAVNAHVESIFHALSGLGFEYIIVDNRSSDGTYELLRKCEATWPNFRVLSRRCSRGLGRNLAVGVACSPTILCVDADTVYTSTLRGFVDRYLQRSREQTFAVQAIYAGLYPRDLWLEVGGMRNLNYADDLDLWMRIVGRGRMRWMPVVMGENRKPEGVSNRNDVFSRRYPLGERVFRLLEREVDFWRVRKYLGMDLEATWRNNAIDLGLGNAEMRWFGPPEPWSLVSVGRRLNQGVRTLLFGRS